MCISMYTIKGSEKISYLKWQLFIANYAIPKQFVEHHGAYRLSDDTKTTLFRKVLSTYLIYLCFILNPIRIKFQLKVKGFLIYLWIECFNKQCTILYLKDSEDIKKKSKAKRKFKK